MGIPGRVATIERYRKYFHINFYIVEIISMLSLQERAA
jgi:hypothetical protein